MTVRPTQDFLRARQESPDGRIPDFFILGAGKSGTTSLFHYLRRHPEIYMPKVKEPRFFLEHHRRIRSARAYLRLFASAGDARRVGEASHAYLTQPASAAMLREVFPAAKFVVILRNPADRAYSLYHHMRRWGREPALSFEAGLEAEEERYRSRRFLKNSSDDPWNFFYFRSGLYGEQMSRYLALFQRSQFHILTLEQLERHPVQTFARLLAFLGVDPAYRPEFKRYFQGRTTARWPSLRVYTRERFEGKGRIARTFGKAINRVNRMAVAPMNPVTRARLLDRYDADLKQLESLTGVQVVNPRVPDSPDSAGHGIGRIR